MTVVDIEVENQYLRMLLDRLERRQKQLRAELELERTKTELVRTQLVLRQKARSVKIGGAR